MGLTAEQILTVLNQGDPFVVAEHELAVITTGYTTGIGRERAAGTVVTLPEETFSPFERGEIVLVGKQDKREPFGEGRSVYKAGVGAFFTDDWAAATALAALVRRDPRPEPGVYEWAEGRWVLTRLADFEYGSPTLTRLGG